ncbi:MAG TPA: biotin/lipoyl-containing protein [Terriglobia bacterium]|nr:biotin/lipoyl-containing protein [Terriglobia bacterium]
MKFHVKTQSGSETFEHVLELPPVSQSSSSAATLEYRMDEKPGKVDWTEVSPGIYSLIVSGRSFEARVAKTGRNGSFEVKVGFRTFHVELRDSKTRHQRGDSAAHHGPQEIGAPMPGRIVKVLVQENAAVQAGQGLLVIEAMKMQNEIRAPRAGRVEKVHVREGEGVESGAPLLSLA